jgi:hypothetical protein
MARRKSWQEKLADSKDLPKIGEVTSGMNANWGSGTFVVPAPLEVDAIMRGVRRGKLITIDEIRKRLAARHGTDTACPITTGIFAWIAAHAADEAEQTGRKRITPYWRTLKSGGELNPKYPGGIAAIQQRLEAEGHTIVQRGKRYFVVNYDRRLARPSATSGQPALARP